MSYIEFNNILWYSWYVLWGICSWLFSALQPDVKQETNNIIKFKVKLKNRLIILSPNYIYSLT